MTKRPPVTLYSRLRDRIASDIAAGVWKPGEAIATEASLSALHDVAIATVRRAVDDLVSDGLVERVAAVGTFVKRPTFEVASIRAMRCYGSAADKRTPGSRIVERSLLQAPRNVSDALKLVLKAEVIRLVRLRFEADAPVAVEEIWLHAQRFRGLLSAPEAHPPLMYPFYESGFGEIVARVEETVAISIADSADATALGVVVGAPIVLLDRLALGYDGRPVEWRRVRASASDFHYKIEIR